MSSSKECCHGVVYLPRHRVVGGSRPRKVSAVAGDADIGWRAGLSLRFARRGERTVPVHRAHYGPLRVQRAFHPEASVCHSYILHPPGGVVGGDCLETEVAVSDGAHALITTPGASKFYRSAGPCARQHQSLRVAEGGALEWLPQEQIVFDGADVSSTLDVVLEKGARFIGWDVLCLGRPAAAAAFHTGCFDARLSVSRDAHPVLHERSRYAGGSELVNAPWGLGGADTVAVMVASGAGDSDVSAVREQLGDAANAGVTRLDDLLVLRWLGHGAERAFATLRPVWRTLRPRLLDLPACEPRIWRT